MLGLIRVEDNGDNITIEINNLPPMPRNRSHSICNGMMIKTPLAREFEKDLKARLQPSLKVFEKFKKRFDIFENFLSSRYVIYTPQDILFTKDGRVSERAVDVDAHKMFTDILYDAIGISDCKARQFTVFTPVSSDGFWNYKITIEIKNKKELYEFPLS